MSPSDAGSRGRRTVKTTVRGSGDERAVTLKDLAERLDVSPATVSVVLNRSPVADSIPKETQDRVFAAARELGYRPNYMARALRRQQTHTVGVLVPEIGEGFSPAVMAGVEDHLVQEGYFYLIASHRWKADLLTEYLQLFADRSVDGLLLINTPITSSPGLPAVTVAGHRRFDGVTNVILDHEQAAELALRHLADLGHRRIAVFRGHPHSGDAADRWSSILRAADGLGLEIPSDSVVELPGVPSGRVMSAEEGYQEGYVLGRKLLDQSSGFTTLFAFNDISAIGAMRAFFDAGLRVPEDVSVVGFDDIMSAAFLNPSLTTVRQPLRQMGETAGRILLERLAGEESHPTFVTVAPELIVRDSTGPPAATMRAGRQAVPVVRRRAAAAETGD